MNCKCKLKMYLIEADEAFDRWFCFTCKHETVTLPLEVFE